MTTQEFMNYQLNDVGNQLKGVFKDLPADAWDKRSTAEAMTPRETAVHLLECYEAFLVESEGKKHNWGTFKPEQTTSEYLLEEMVSKRGRCMDIAIKSTDPEVIKHASSFIIVHDAYHVGQLATLRLQLGEWDPYSIYK